MDRTEVIAAIERLREDSVHIEKREEFAEEVKKNAIDTQMQREEFSADFQRAVLFLFFLMLPDRRLPKAQQDFLRPNRRSMLIWICMVGLFVAQALLITKGANAFGFEKWSVAIVVVLFVLELFGLIWFMTKIQPRRGLTELGMSSSCIQCEYELSGLESVLGDDIWVGPAVCPECGMEYPAVGK